MFVIERYIVILICLLECDIGQCAETTKALQHRKLEEKMSPVFKNNKNMKNEKMHVRHNLITNKDKKENTITPKWPKHLRQGKTKSTIRITKMDMLQETEDATAVAEISAEKSERSYLSSYRIKQDLQKLQNEMPNINITLEVIGRTLEYQDIIMLRISESKESSKYFRADDNRYAEEVPEKKIIFIVHGLSVMGMASLPCLSSLTAFKTLFSFYTAHLDKFDIFFIPMANPDGFAHTWTYSSYWNKNVAPQSECPGVSLDRNFEVAWENNRTISSCSQEYPGPEPFSEEETRAIRDVFHKYAHKIIAYLNVHAGSYSSSVFRGDAVLYPKGYSENAVDDDKYIDLKGEIDEAIRNASFQVLSVAVESLYNWYGKITGSSVDYASTIYGIPYALELVMQHYEDGSDSANSNSEYYTDLALTEVWKRIIDVIFGYVWKSVHGNDSQQS